MKINYLSAQITSPPFLSYGQPITRTLTGLITNSNFLTVARIPLLLKLKVRKAIIAPVTEPKHVLVVRDRRTNSQVNKERNNLLNRFLPRNHSDHFLSPYRPVCVPIMPEYNPPVNLFFILSLAHMCPHTPPYLPTRVVP